MGSTCRITYGWGVYVTQTQRLGAGLHGDMESALVKHSAEMLQVPMFLKFFIYFGLYYTLPRDRIEEVEAVGKPPSLSAHMAICLL